MKTSEASPQTDQFYGQLWEAKGTTETPQNSGESQRKVAKVAKYGRQNQAALGAIRLAVVHSYQPMKQLTMRPPALGR